jgi:gas vesicle protein
MDQFNQDQDPLKNPKTGVEWTEIGSGFGDKPESNTEKHAQDSHDPSQAGNSAYDSDWAETSLDEIKAGLKQISSALKHAVDHGKEDPRLKKFGEDVKESLNNISEEISDFFKKL